MTRSGLSTTNMSVVRFPWRFRSELLVSGGRMICTKILCKVFSSLKDALSELGSELICLSAAQSFFHPTSPETLKKVKSLGVNIGCRLPLILSNGFGSPVFFISFCRSLKKTQRTLQHRGGRPDHNRSSGPLRILYIHQAHLNLRSHTHTPHLSTVALIHTQQFRCGVPP